MNRRFVAACLSLILFTGVCSAQSKPKHGPMSLAEVKARIDEARASEERVIVELKSGGSVSGLVTPFHGYPDQFLLIHSHGLFGPGETESFHYDQVANIRKRNGFVKAIKGIGTVSVVAAVAAVILPVQIVSMLLGHPIFEDC